MIQFHRHRLDNGLRVLIHEDKTTPMVALCLSYDVGTRDEDPERTGFAHLFEHLMFGGSKHAPDFDTPLQTAGGENNAYTNQDATVYYELLPRENWEVALWLEADRMEHLSLSKRALNVQRKVVVEEFKETCLNEPYGDVWHYIGELAYRVHPYSIPTIGKTPEHIAGAELTDVKAFFERFYAPNNAVLSISGHISPQEALAGVEKWFGRIAPRPRPPRNLPSEPPIEQARRKTVWADVPLDALFICFHCAPRRDDWYYTDDLISDILGGGESARLHQELVKKRPLFAEIDAYLSGTDDTGLLVIEGKVAEGVALEQAERAVWELLEELKCNTLTENELRKLKNRVEHSLEFGETGTLNKAISLGYFELLGDADRINTEAERYERIDAEQIRSRARMLFRPEASATLEYRKKA